MRKVKRNTRIKLTLDWRELDSVVGVDAPRVALDGLEMSLVPDVDALAARGVHGLLGVMVDAGEERLADDGLQRMELSGARLQVVAPVLDHLVVAAREERGALAAHAAAEAAHADAAHEALVRIVRLQALLVGQVPHLDLAVARAREEHVELLRMLEHAVDAVLVTVEAAQKGLGQDALELCRVESARVLARHLQRMQLGVVVARHFEYVLLRLANVFARIAAKHFHLHFCFCY